MDNFPLCRVERIAFATFLRFPFNQHSGKLETQSTYENFSVFSMIF